MADCNSAIFLLFYRSSAVFFSDSCTDLLAFALYSSIRDCVRLLLVVEAGTVEVGAEMLFLVSRAVSSSFLSTNWSLSF